MRSQTNNRYYNTVLQTRSFCAFLIALALLVTTGLQDPRPPSARLPNRQCSYRLMMYLSYRARLNHKQRNCCPIPPSCRMRSCLVHFPGSRRLENSLPGFVDRCRQHSSRKRH